MLCFLELHESKLDMKGRRIRSYIENLSKKEEKFRVRIACQKMKKNLVNKRLPRG